VLSYVSFHRSVHRDFDQHLLHELNVLLPLVEFGEDGPKFSQFQAMRTVAYQTDGVLGTYIRLLDTEGNVLYHSPNLDGHPPLAVLLPAQTTPSVAAQTWQDRPMRSHYHPLTERGGKHVGWLEVSGFEWTMHQELNRLVRTFSLGILVSFVLALGGGYLLARRALRPVASITRVANEIQASSLDKRIPIDGHVKDELTRLADTINGLLARIQASFHRERRFSANAAHELVTPLAAVRGELELALRGSGVPEEMRPQLSVALEDCDRMNGIIRSLLLLSSAERLERAKFEALDMGAILREHLERFADRAKVEDKSISRSLSGPCTVRANRDGLAKVIDNLLDNALKYTESGARIRVDLSCAEGFVRLTVSDDGIGFVTEDGQHLFDRFFRANTLAVKERSGSGLGLAIVAATIGAFGGTVGAESEGPGLGSRFTVTLPLAT
jgi:signal transduction histidine kinase